MNKKSKSQPDLTKEQQHAKDVEIIRREKTLNTYLKTGHGMPTTRRELLGSGLLAGFGFLALPSLLTLVGREAQAAGLSADCKALLDPVGGMMPYMQIILGGGACLHSNSLVLDQGRQLLPTYARLGIGNNNTFTTKTEFGNVPLAVRNGVYAGHIMRGLTQAAGADAIRNTNMVKFCVSSLDDKANRDGILGMVNAAGLRGTLLPNVTQNGLSRTAYVSAGPTQRIGSQAGLLSSLSPQGALKAAMAQPTRRDALLNLVNKLSAGQRARLATSDSGAELGRFVECATGKNIDLATVDTAQLDPRLNPDVAAIWGLNSATADNDAELLRASVTLSILKGFAGGGGMSKGGYDYHGQMRADTDALDYAGGEMIGKVLKTAHALKKPVFIHVTSDGAIEGGGPEGIGNHGADAGSRGSGFFMIYDPAGRRETTDIQIGHFNKSAAVDNTFLSGWNVERCALAVFANYLQANKKLSMLDQIVPGVFGPADLSKILKVA